MKIILKSLFLFSFFILNSLADEKVKLECTAVEYVDLVLKNGKSESTHSTDNGKFTLELSHNKSYIMNGNDKSEIILLSVSSQDTMYYVEKTASGNINLMALFKNGDLTVSKSFDLLGMAITSNITYWKCR